MNEILRCLRLFPDFYIVFFYAEAQVERSVLYPAIICGGVFCVYGVQNLRFSAIAWDFVGGRFLFYGLAIAAPRTILVENAVCGSDLRFGCFDEFDRCVCDDGHVLVYDFRDGGDPSKATVFVAGL